MAPSVRGSSARVGKSQATLRSFGKVSKAAPSSLGIKAQVKKAVAIAQVLTEIQPCASAGLRAKRRREDESDDEDIVYSPFIQLENARIKKQKLQLVTPPSSQLTSDGDSDVSPTTIPSLHSLRLNSSPNRNASPARPSTPEELSSTLRNILSIHEVFLKALSIHFAHNGAAAPAELSALLTTITVIWKKRKVVIEDIQRMLGLYEISENVAVLEFSQIKHNVSPFKLTSSGLRTCVEYVSSIEGPKGLTRGPFNERCLQVFFRSIFMALVVQSRSNPALAFLNGPLSIFPLLACSVGAQTVARREKASTRLNTILSLSADAQARKQPKPQMELCVPGEEQTETQIAVKVKSRTQSLFDRVRAKQLTNASNTKPTAESILRRHAIGRIGEVVEILRMKQQQKMSSTFVSAVHVSPSKMRNKVSFSLGQLVHEIKGSVSVPIGDDEAKMCLKMIAHEVPGFWVSMFEMGNGESRITSVVLNGMGVSGMEVMRLLEEKEKSC